MKFLKEFREFAVKGNMMDLAIGLVLGTAFGRVIASIVGDILTPPIALLTGGVQFGDRFFVMRGDVASNATLAQAREGGAVVFAWGNFVSNLIEFTIVAFALFIVVKQINRFRRKAEPTPVSTKACPACFTKVPLAATKCSGCTSEIAV